MAASEGGHAHSIVHGPVNKLWDLFLNTTGLDARWGHIEVPDHVAMSLLIMVLIAAVAIPMRSRLRVDKPGKFQQLLELFVEGLDSMLEDNIGHGAGKRYLPLVGALGMFIFLANFSGLFFFLQPPSASLNFTLALALVTFFYYHFVGIKKQGFSYFKFLLGPVPAMFLLFIPLELVSHGARALSLSFRLFGNVFGEHAASGAFAGIVPIIVPLPVMALGLFGAALQAFIFVMLTVVYLAGAEATEH